MEKILLYFDQLLASHTTQEMAVLCLLVVAFFIQAWYYGIAYARIPKYRNSRKKGSAAESPAISVVVVLQDDYSYLENTLPRMMAQDYPVYEVVLVSVGTTANFEDELMMRRARYDNLTTTRIAQDPKFPISTKMALNVGIKAAKYDHIIILTPDAYPVSQKWLPLMAKGFAGSDVVIGYCGLEARKGITNRLHRCSRLMMSVRYLSSAIRGVPYRGILQNLGLTKQAYFDAKGFNHLNMNIGEDDLFIQRIANRGNTGIVMNPHATMRQRTWDTGGRWRARRRFYSYTFRFYPPGVKAYISTELISRALFFASAIAALLLFPCEVMIGVGVVILLRLLLVMRLTARVSRRLGERGLVWASLLYDLWAPVSEATLSISRSTRKVSGVWR